MPSPEALLPCSETVIADRNLSLAACEEIYAQRTGWIGRRLHGKLPMYTLGAAAYLDLGFFAKPLEEYLAAAGSVRRWAGDAVTVLMERVRAELELQLGERVEYFESLPSPGFHIFIGAAIPQTDCARVVSECASSHFDLQYHYIPWERWFKAADFDRTLSFTLPLRLPEAGGGLEVWESLTLGHLRDELARNAFPDQISAAHRTPPRYVPYTVGSMIVHGGHVLHQIAGVPYMSAMDERITLQGHAIFADGAWRLYW